MQFLREKVLIKIDQDKLDEYNSDQKQIEGTDLVLVTKWQKQESGVVPQEATVIETPMSRELDPGASTFYEYGDEKPDVEVSNGDRVFVHHHVVEPENEVEIDGDLFHAINHQEIYFKYVGDKIKMINTYNLVEPLYEDESNFKTDSGIYTKAVWDDPKVPLMGKLVYANDRAKEDGLKEGVTIYYKPGSECTVKVDGKEYYRIGNHRILGYVEEEL